MGILACDGGSSVLAAYVALWMLHLQRLDCFEWIMHHPAHNQPVYEHPVTMIKAEVAEKTFVNKPV